MARDNSNRRDAIQDDILRTADSPDGTHDPIIVTGMGLMTSAGLFPQQALRAIVEHRTRMGSVTAVESPLPQEATGGQAMELPSMPMDSLDDITLPRETRYLRATIVAAMRDAGLLSQNAPPDNPARTMLVLGTTLHGLRAGGRFLRQDDPEQLKDFLADAIATRAMHGLGIYGGTLTTCSACSSSLGAIALGATLLRNGSADIIIAGGYDPMSEYAWAGFASLRLVTPNTLRPFAKDRMGMKLAEGYGIVVLERANDAKRRGAGLRACLAGWGESADAHHLTKPHPEGDGAARAMRTALARAEISPRDLGMIASHATGTPDNDASEHAALVHTLGEHAPNVPIVGFKSHLGHTLGGAGAVELILSMQAMREEVVPACANVSMDDIEYPDINVATGNAVSKRWDAGLNVSLGFGGANTCVIIRREASPMRGLASSPRKVWITGMGVLHATGFDPLLPAWTQPRGAFDDTMLAPWINTKKARRLSTYARCAVAAIAKALAHTGLAPGHDVVAGACAFLGSMHASPSCCIDFYKQIVTEGVLAGNPVLFAEGVPNAAAAHASTMLGIRGACQTIIGSRCAGLDAIGLAFLRVSEGASDVALIGACEESHPIVDRVYRECGLQAQQHTNTSDFPDPALEQGFVSHAGAIAFVLEDASHARARGARCLARFEQVAWANTTTPASMHHAVASVLTKLGPPARVLGSGTGTWLDRAEALGAREAGLDTSSMHEDARHVGEQFSVTAMGVLARLLADERREHIPYCVLSSTWTGACTGIRLHRDA